MMKSTRFATLVCLLLSSLLAGVLASGCEADDSSKAPAKQSAEAPAEQKDAPAEEPRIVSLGGVVTEIVYALDAGDQVVAVDKSSVYPEATEKVRHLDLFRKVSAESVLSYEPTLVLTTAGAKPDKAFERIEKAGVKVLRLSADETIEAAKERIKTVGEAVGRVEKARELVSQLDADLEAAKKAADGCETSAKTLFMYARGRGTTFVAGKDTSAARMIELAGATHVPQGIDGFKPMTAEAVMKAEPEVVLMTDSGLESMGGVEGLARVKGLSKTRAVNDERVVTMTDLELLGFGPRTGKAVGKLAKSLCLEEERAQK